MTLCVRGVGTAVPEHAITQAQAAQLCAELGNLSPREARVMAGLYHRTGITRRGSVLLRTSDSGVTSEWAGRYDPTTGPPTSARMDRYQAHAPQLAVAAVRAALVDAQVDRHDVTHLVTVSCTGFSAPGLDSGLIERIGLRRTVRRAHIGFMGCHGALNGLDVAHAFVAANRHHTVLLCAVELPTLHFSYGFKAETVVSNGIFADGAAALVASQAAQRDELSPWLLRASGSCVLTDSAGAMTWSIGDRGFAMTLDAAVPNLIAAQLRPWLERWLLEHGLGLSDVRSWGVHPGGPRILDAVHGTLDLGPHTLDVSRDVLAEHGNMSSPTLLFILKRLIAANAPRPCVLLGFGPGLVAEAALFDG